MSRSCCLHICSLMAGVQGLEPSCSLLECLGIAARLQGLLCPSAFLPMQAQKERAAARQAKMLAADEEDETDDVPGRRRPAGPLPTLPSRPAWLPDSKGMSLAEAAAAAPTPPVQPGGQTAADRRHQRRRPTSASGPAAEVAAAAAGGHAMGQRRERSPAAAEAAVAAAAAGQAAGQHQGRRQPTTETPAVAPAPGAPAAAARAAAGPALASRGRSRSSSIAAGPAGPGAQPPALGQMPLESLPAALRAVIAGEQPDVDPHILPGLRATAQVTL